MKKILIAILIATAFLPVCSCRTGQQAGRAGGTAASQARLKIICSTFPIWLFTRNVVGDQPDVSVEALLPPQTGCPHDYALRPQDMEKIAGADILIINGLGMEEFLGQSVQNANPNIVIIDSSSGITDLLAMKDEEHEGSGHNHTGVNPHLFASPRQAARLIRNVAGRLSTLDPAGAKTYQANAAANTAKLDALADEFSSAAKQLKSNKLVTQHAIFDYLARDAGLSISAVLEAEPGQSPSAAKMVELVKLIKASGAAAIFVEPQYSANVGAAVGKEASLPVASLDPVASGPENAPLDYYIVTMRNNIDVLRGTIGTK